LATWADHRGGTTAGEPAGALLERARVLEVPGLDKGATRTLLTAVAGRPVSDEALALIQQHSSGQPLAAIELYRHLAEEGHVGRPGGDSLPSLDQLPRRLEDIVAWRSARLAPESRSALAALACLADGATPAIVAPVAGLTRTRAVDALEPAVAAGLVEIDDAERRYRLAHDRIRRAVLATLEPPRRAAAYRRAAEVLEAESGSDSRQQAAPLADLWLRSAAADGAAAGLRHLLLAAEQARACAAYGRAATILAAAATLVGRDRAADDVRQRLLQAQAEAGDGDGVLATAAALVGGDGKQGGNARHRVELGPLVDAARLLRSHGLEPAVAALVQLARQAAGTPDRLTGARLDLLAEHWQPAAGGAPLQIWAVGDGSAEQVILAEGIEADRAELFAPQRPRSHERTVGLLGMTRGWRRPASLLAALRGACADLTTRLGRWQEARSWAGQYLSAAERYGSPRHVAEAQLHLARCHALLGALDGAAEALASADEIIDRLDDGSAGPAMAELREASVLAA
ncbi:MAG TPA: hypothetical protein VH741_08380, partial [Candidatus Limnocylindrales bacterium]